MRPAERGSVMLAALVVVAVTAAVSAALATLAHSEIVLARNRDAAAQAQSAADGCLAAVVAGLPAGWDFDQALAGPDGTAGTTDDGLVPTPAGCSTTLVAAPGPSLPPRVLADVTAVAGSGRRLVRGVVGRTSSPDSPALLWLAEAGSLGPDWRHARPRWNGPGTTLGPARRAGGGARGSRGRGRLARRARHAGLDVVGHRPARATAAGGAALRSPGRRRRGDHRDAAPEWCAAARAHLESR